jgi:hypothetical protein
VVTPHDRERTTRVGPDSALHVLDPRAVHPEWDLMFGLARNGARVTSNARRLIDHESVSQRLPPSLIGLYQACSIAITAATTSEASRPGASTVDSWSFTVLRISSSS